MEGTCGNRGLSWSRSHTVALAAVGTLAVGVAAVMVFTRLHAARPAAGEITGVVKMAPGSSLGAAGRVLPPKGFEAWGAAEWDKWLEILNSQPFNAAAA